MAAGLLVAKQPLSWARRTPAEGQLGVEPGLGLGLPFVMVEVASVGEAGLAAETCREGRSSS